MTTPQEDAMAKIRGEFHAKRRAQIKDKHAKGFYMDAKPIVKGKTKAAVKAEKKAAWKNRHNDPNYKGLSGGYMNN